MAIWQFDPFVLNANDVCRYSVENGWSLPPIPAGSILAAQRELLAALGHPWQMMPDWLVFGTENGNRVDLLFDGDDNVEIRIRLVASASDSELDGVCAFVGAFGGRLFDPATESTLHPDRKTLRAALSHSRAAQHPVIGRAFPPSALPDRQE